MEFLAPLRVCTMAGVPLVSPRPSEQGRHSATGAGRTQKALVILGGSGPTRQVCLPPLLTGGDRGPER